MKTKVTGKRFSKRTVLTFGEGDLPAFDAHLVASIPLDSLQKTIAHNVEAARERLRASSLPDVPLVQAEREACTLPAYVAARYKDDPDSPEYLAAEIIWAAHLIETASGEIRDAALYKLGRLVQLAITYGITKSAATKSAGNPRPSRQKIPPDADTSDVKRWALKYGVTKSAVRAKRKRDAAKPAKNES